MEQNHTILWEKCLAIFRDILPEEQFDAWFKPVSSISYQDNKLNVLVPSPFFVEQLDERYIKLITSTLHRVYGPDVKLFYHFNQVKEDPQTGVTIESDRRSQDVSPIRGATSNPFTRQEDTADIDAQLNPRYTFENYCNSVSNRVARSIGEAIATDPKCKTFNPLFVFGAPGVGKTHLIQAIGIRIKERNPRARVLYVTARLFESQFTTAMKNNRINDFINFYQSIDTLILDDIQDLIGKTSTQRTFFHIFNHLQLNQKQIILSSDTKPSLMEGMEQRMLDRFKWGMTAELEKPDYELRRNVLELKAKQEGLNLPDDVLDYIAGNVTESIRELEGIMVSLVAHATVLNMDINIDLARRVLSNAVKINLRQINFEIITQEVSSYYNIEPDQLFTKSRKREISDARQMVMFLAKKHTKMPLKAIGTRLDRTHATVLYACKNIEERLPLEKKLQEDVNAIESTLLS
ncbi:MAG: chromosomal replication initiator protein DnaA [Paramuribaculum sp.]|nr:chromosomal replication initiator protein DnaA [Barnesiella sp.]MDE5821117.1 chromosomal replication initiator protein DnaA [Paramuribaculum sp.]MDE5835506.1 chromosomal replication initiator protein DnaA [Paramuribaculum sp.]